MASLTLTHVSLYVGLQANWENLTRNQKLEGTVAQLQLKTTLLSHALKSIFWTSWLGVSAQLYQHL